jgi:hypothetical protein
MHDAQRLHRLPDAFARRGRPVGVGVPTREVTLTTVETKMVEADYGSTGVDDQLASDTW